MMKDDGGVSHVKAWRHRELHSLRLELADLMHGEGRLVGDDGPTLRPQRPADQVVVEIRHPLGQAKQAAIDP